MDGKRWGVWKAGGKGISEMGVVVVVIKMKVNILLIMI